MKHLIASICAGLLATTAWAQTPASDQQTTACQFADGGQVSVRYEAAPVHGDRLPEGQPWSPAESPMYLFTSTALKSGDTQIPIGAYSLFVIPEKQHWTLAVNKDVNSKKYDPQQDLVRLPMDLGTMDQPVKTVNLTLGHVAPKQCSLRLYYGKTGGWVVFNEP